MTTEFKQIWLRGGTAGQWASANPVLSDREIAVEEATSPATSPRLKVGDGITPWNTLKYVDQDLFGAYVAKAGDTMSGPLTVSGTSSIRVQIDTATSGVNEAQLRWSTGGLLRWQMRKADNETGANAGGNFYWDRFNDAGAYGGTVLSVNRATGIVNVGIGLTAPTVASNDNSTNVATTAWVRTFNAAALAARTSTTHVPSATVLTANNNRAVQTNMVPDTTASIHTSNANGITVPAGVHLVTVRVDWNATTTVARTPAIFDGTLWHMLSSSANTSNELQQEFTAVIVTTGSTLLQWGALALTITGTLRTIASNNNSTMTVVTL